MKSDKEVKRLFLDYAASDKRSKATILPLESQLRYAFIEGFLKGADLVLQREKTMIKTTQQELHQVHYLVLCSECGRVSVWASQNVAEPQRNWHELQHLEGVMGKQTVVQVQVIPE